MATITKSAAAPADVEYFSVGQVDFTLSPASPKFVTSDQAVIGNAIVNDWLDVQFDSPVIDPDAPQLDQNDPHVNASADHLSNLASPEAIAAAKANQAAISKTVAAEINSDVGGPTVADTVASTLEVIGVASSAKLPVDEVVASTADEVVASTADEVVASSATSTKTLFSPTTSSENN